MVFSITNFHLAKTLTPKIYRFSSQSQRSKCVHNQINPQHLNRFNNLLRDKSSANKSQNNRANINSELKLQEFFNRIINISPPQNSLHNRIKIIIQQNNRCSFSRNLSTSNSHREPNISLKITPKTLPFSTPGRHLFRLQ